MLSEVKFELDAKTILSVRGLGADKRAVNTLLSEIKRLSDKRVPMDQGILKDTATIIKNRGQLIYTQPYSRVMYYGKVMVGATPGHKTPMHASEKNITYQGAPNRGSYWIKRTIVEDKAEIAKAVEKVTGGKVVWA